MTEELSPTLFRDARQAVKLCGKHINRKDLSREEEHAADYLLAEMVDILNNQGYSVFPPEGED